MTYLLLSDAQRSEDYAHSADVFLKYAAAENKMRYAYIMDFDIKDLGLFQSVKTEVA